MLDKSEQEIVDLSRVIAYVIPDGTEIGLAISALTLVIKGAVETVSPNMRAACWDIVNRFCSQEIERNTQ
jgi:hypothetical protein